MIDYLDNNYIIDIEKDARNKVLQASSYQDMEYIIKNMPGMTYAIMQFQNYLYSNGLTTTDIEEDKKLTDWLYTTNKSGTTNYDVLRSATTRAGWLGYAGLRKHEGNIYFVPNYDIKYFYDDNGIQQIVGYVFKKDGDNLNTTNDTEIIKKLAEKNTNPSKFLEELKDYYKNQNLIFIAEETKEFLHLRNNFDSIKGEPKLLNEKLRIQSVITTLSQLIDDLNNYTPGRLVMFEDGSVYGALDTDDKLNNDIQIDKALKGAIKQKTNKDAKREEIERDIAKKIKNSNTKSIIVLPNWLKDKLEVLPKQVKASDILELINQIGVEVSAQVLGLSPQLLGVGKVSGNISMSSIIDDCMLNNIIPMREMFSNQFSKFIADIVGVKLVKYNEYELKQKDSISDLREKMAKTVYYMSNSAVNLQKYGDNDVSVLKKAIDDMATIIDKSLTPKGSNELGNILNI